VKRTPVGVELAGVSTREPSFSRGRRQTSSETTSPYRPLQRCRGRGVTLDNRGSDATLIIPGGLRTESDFMKALALGADRVGVSHSALQAVGCLGTRACLTNNCPVGIATQKPSLRARLEVAMSPKTLANWFGASVEWMQVMARACGHDHLSKFETSDPTTWKRDVAYLTGVSYGWVVPL